MQGPSPRALLGLLAVSFGLHSALITCAALFAVRTEQSDATVHEVTIAFEPAFESDQLGSNSSQPQARLPEVEERTLGGSVRSSPDVASAGHGRPARQAAVNLASRLADVSVVRETYNHPESSQTHRLRTAAERASLDRRRATPEPMTLSFLATGTGKLQQRRRFASTPAGRGRNELRRPISALGARERPMEEGDQELLPKKSQSGHPRLVRHFGVAIARPENLARAVSVRRARPDVRRGRAAVPAETRARPKDDVDSRLAVKQRMAALISASTLGGGSAVGKGGVEGTRAGTGGRTFGGRSRHSGPNQFGAPDDAQDSRETVYFGYVRSRLGALTNRAFPLQAKLEGRGGAALLSFRITKDGLLQQIRVTRASGVPEFDKNLVAALKRLSLKPPPGGSVQLSFRFDAINPPVGRR